VREASNNVLVSFKLPENVFKTETKAGAPKLLGYVEYRLTHTTTKYKGTSYDVQHTTDPVISKVSPLPVGPESTPSDIEKAIRRIRADFGVCISAFHCDEFESPGAIDFPETDQSVVNIQINHPEGDRQIVTFKRSADSST
jgi:hypothetical protein